MATIAAFRFCDHRDHNYHRCSSETSEVNSLDDSDSVDSCLVGPDQEEEFYASSLTPPTPSEDIWKKFELYPTPPLSPSHPDGAKEAPAPTRSQEGEADLLQEVTNILMDDDDLPWMTRTCHFSDPVFRAPSPVTPPLIQDCMWSSIIAEERRKFFLKTEKKSEEKAKKAVPSSNSGLMLPPLVPASEYGSSDCVDPSAVFPYPLSETRLDLFSTGTNTPSDSEEEIDVVTVEKKLTNHRHHHHKSHTTRPYHRHHTAKPRAHPPQQQSINITLLGKRGRPSNATILSIPIKKLKTEGNLEEVKQMLQKSNLVRTSSAGNSRVSSRGSSRGSSRPSSQPGSHPSSDSEDTEKRACHNVLERKRREDLRTSFLHLRDEVPELNSSDRAAKVVILKKATDYVISLQDTEESLKMELERETRRNLDLRERLEALLAPHPV
ncbi:myc protein-like isoform X2 [Acanthaster planci]|nr:myc protein-like isoform X2 [Acanthaster planci]